MQKMQIHGGEKKVGADGRAFRHTWDASHSFHMHSHFEKYIKYSCGIMRNIILQIGEI